ncbi:response regulator transcription factor [Sphingomonas sp. C3-2]|uniref:response regulator transcription factor n=1 Tax=Sphingomonas sp. C3-2 TaxID=3062169 RepID=UPI00294B1596|nr:response regulator [Sphingomonas sp. C3-2]WOK37464.1 response regulator [Sphingomonas sp. C3-2]
MTEKLVYLVDDEEAIRRSAGFMLRTSGFKVESFASGVEFLKDVRDLPLGCVLLDIRMPGMDGLEVQQALIERGVAMPVVIMTGHGDVNIAVRAMKAGAIDFIEKPFEKAVLMAALDQAQARLDRSGQRRTNAEEAATRLKILTPREREVLDGLVEGLPNKTIAFDLGISPRTVEIHRANLMAKLEVRSLSEALRLAFAAADVDTPAD